MSIETMNAVWKHSKADGRARLVLLAIADHQGEIGAWPSLATLSKMVNASERSVQRDINYLQDIGELEVHYQQAPTRNHYKSNLYFVKLTGVTELPTGVTNTEGGVTNTEGGVTAVGVQSLNRTITEPLENSLVSEMFDQFWKEYPRRSDKRAALKAFKSALSRASFEEILAGAILYATDPNLPDVKYQKHPATWLNADAWENGPIPADPRRQKEREKKQAELDLEEYIRREAERGN
jgi:hypothetical protein